VLVAAFIDQMSCRFVLCATELIAFPAGGIAAIVIATVVVVMVVAKVICVVTGYERRLPNIDFDYDNDMVDDDQRKQIIHERQSTECASNVAPVDSDDVISTNTAS